jgi:hypothetical protein
MAANAKSIGGRAWAQDMLPKLVLAPSLAAVLLFVYGFILFTGYLSFTNSKILPSFDLIGFENYARLFGLRHWSTALTNLAIFGGLYIVVCNSGRNASYLAPPGQIPARGIPARGSYFECLAAKRMRGQG